MRMVVYSETDCPTASTAGSKSPTDKLSPVDTPGHYAKNLNYGPSPKPTVYIITPTYERPQQRPDLTRLAQTLMHVPNLHWILVEDGVTVSPWVGQLLRSYGLNFTLLACHRYVQIYR